MAGRVRLAAAGFLFAVLWFDLMFDVQALGPRAADGTLAVEAVASMAAYYRRVTTDAWPMGALVATVMLLLVASTLHEAGREPPRWRGLLGLVLAGVPVALALTRVLPNAIALGAGTGSPIGDAALARAIAVDHVACLAGMAAYLALQLSRRP